MDITKKLNDILVSLFNSVLKMEEDAIKNSSKHNLSITEVHTLTAIGTGKAKTMTQVSASLKISVSTLTTAINKLVDKKYVNRFRVPEDRRIVKIELTEEGAEAVQEHERFHRKMIDDVLAELNEEEQAILLNSLDNLHEFFKRQRIRAVKGDAPTKLAPLTLGDVTIPVPIFQGGMGIGVSLSRPVCRCRKMRRRRGDLGSPDRIRRTGFLQQSEGSQYPRACREISGKQKKRSRTFRTRA